MLPLRWRHNDHNWHLKSPASRLFTQPFIQTQIKVNIKAPRHWPLCGEFTGTGEFPAQRSSYAENVSIWWRHHAMSWPLHEGTHDNHADDRFSCTADQMLSPDQLRIWFRTRELWYFSVTLLWLNSVSQWIVTPIFTTTYRAVLLKHGQLSVQCSRQRPLARSWIRYGVYRDVTSSNGNIFRVTGPLCGEPPVTGEFPTQSPVTQSFDVFFDLRLNRRLSKPSRPRWFETSSRSLWRHCNVVIRSLQLDRAPAMSLP